MDRIYFPPGSTELEGDHTPLDAFASLALNDPTVNLVLIPRTPEAQIYAADLSERRTHKILVYLREKGVPADRVVVLDSDARAPVAPEHTDCVELVTEQRLVQASP